MPHLTGKEYSNLLAKLYYWMNKNKTENNSANWENKAIELRGSLCIIKKQLEKMSSFYPNHYNLSGDYALLRTKIRKLSESIQVTSQRNVKIDN